MPACRVYLINLDRSPERLAEVGGRLSALGFDWTRAPAVDGRAIGPQPWPGFDAAAFDRCFGKTPNPNEYGCYLSHIAAMRIFLADGGEAALILEDDARLSDHVPLLVDDLLARPGEWDVVKLGGRHRAFPRTMRALPAGHRLVTFRLPHRGSVAYLLNRRAAELYLAALLPMSLPYDHVLEKAWQFGVRLRGVLPPPVLDGFSPSTIGHGRAVRAKKPWYRRGSVLLYRTGNEFRRLCHYLFTDTEWMSARPSRTSD